MPSITASIFTSMLVTYILLFASIISLIYTFQHMNKMSLVSVVSLAFVGFSMFLIAVFSSGYAASLYNKYSGYYPSLIIILLGLGVLCYYGSKYT